MSAIIIGHDASKTQIPKVDEATAKECQGILERHARSFSAAAVFLSPRMRRDAAVCYAFCRLVDDAVDEAQDETAAAAQIAHFEAMLEGRVEASPIVGAYISLAERLGFGLGPARDLLAGARSDLGRVRIESDAEFLEYCYRVAGTVGLMMCGVLGVREPNARRHAIHLGIAMQMTNICRDVLEDALRDRVYLPAPRLFLVGVSQVEILRVATMSVGEGGVMSAASHPEETRRRVEKGVSAVVLGILEWAECFYDSGAQGLRWIPRRPRLAIMVAKVLYHEIGQALRARGANPFGGRVRVTPLRKWILTVHASVNWLMGSGQRPQVELELPARVPSK